MRLLRSIADLRLAIALLLAIALFSVSGTLIEQGQAIAYYQQNYPENPALFGFLSWKVLLFLGLDRVYSTWWFLSLLVLFGSSLTACTFTRQLPTLKAARRWQFFKRPGNFEKLALSAELPAGTTDAIADLLQSRSYKVFRAGDTLYARKGIAGRIGPIVVHASMLLVLAGAIWGTLTGFTSQEMIPSGNRFQIHNITSAGPWAQSPMPLDWSLRVNRFWIDYAPDGSIDQFYSDLSVLDGEGNERDRQTIHVNQPLRASGVTFYQTNWGVAGVKVRINNSPQFRLPAAQLDTGGNGRMWGTWVPIKPDMSAGVSLLTRDLQGTLMAYDSAGNLAGAVRTGSSIHLDGVTLFVDELIGSTGLQIKSDPGIPIVYAGFGFLMLGVMMSYVSHSQVWALQSGDRLFVGGKTNRAQLTFERELLGILERLTEQKL
ncbi:cytochrome c biogenesis protein [Rubidibacter lacunae]|nr:cytochrome c biogenesis protein [Rubidibacter lacunae]